MRALEKYPLLALIMTAGILSACSKSDHSFPPPAPTDTPIKPATQPSAPTPSLKAETIDLSISNSALSLAKGYHLKVLVGKSWAQFSALKPKGDLTGRELQLRSLSSANTGSRIQAKVTCKNKTCSQSDVVLSNGSQRSELSINQIRMAPLGGEVQRGCQIPIYFDYELDDVFEDSQERDETLLSIEQIKRTTEIYFTQTSTKSADRKSVNTVRIDLNSDKEKILSVSTSVLSQQKKAVFNVNQLPKKTTITYQLAPAPKTSQETSADFNHVTFHFALSGRSVSELCYYLPLIPDTLN